MSTARQLHAISLQRSSVPALQRWLDEQVLAGLLSKHVGRYQLTEPAACFVALALGGPIPTSHQPSSDPHQNLRAALAPSISSASRKDRACVEETASHQGTPRISDPNPAAGRTQDPGLIDHPHPQNAQLGRGKERRPPDMQV